MKINYELIDVIGLILLFVGIFTAMTPHATHLAAFHPAEHRHVEEIATGLIVMLVGLGVLIFSHRKQG